MYGVAIDDDRKRFPDPLLPLLLASRSTLWWY
jgi:hypothetical protein